MKELLHLALVLVQLYPHGGVPKQTSPCEGGARVENYRLSGSDGIENPAITVGGTKVVDTSFDEFSVQASYRTWIGAYKVAGIEAKQEGSWYSGERSSGKTVVQIKIGGRKFSKVQTHTPPPPTEFCFSFAQNQLNVYTRPKKP